tara:strand:- start:366 stop:1187 length:822 start_codon:yes stop_codon:yes gene_type:complete
MRRPPLNELQDSLDFIFGSLEESDDSEFEDYNDAFNAEIDDQLERLGGLQIPQVSNSVSDDFRELNAITSRFFVGNLNELATPTTVSDTPLFLNTFWQNQATEERAHHRELVYNSLKTARYLMHQELEVAALNFFLVSDALPDEIASNLVAAGHFEFEILLDFREDQWAKYWGDVDRKQIANLRERLKQELTERNDYRSPITVWKDSWDLITSDRYCLRRGNSVRGSFNIRRIAFNLELGTLKPSDKLCRLSGGMWHSFAGLLESDHTSDSTN